MQSETYLDETATSDVPGYTSICLQENLPSFICVKKTLPWSHFQLTSDSFF